LGDASLSPAHIGGCEIEIDGSEVQIQRGVSAEPRPIQCS
jgi:hypothetical protein